ncbi:hypothetical protein HDV00_002476 [Rhizophlyctis rosea]|nr:hypothetical protein HDV00_002476 [Rhizophlyctis rosea]
MPTYQHTVLPLGANVRTKCNGSLTVNKRLAQDVTDRLATAPALASACSVLVYHLWETMASSSSSSTTEVTMEHVFLMTQWRSRRKTFRLFCTRLLSQTRVAPAVALVALSYIERLRSRNPGVEGGEGFEFRLFAVAVMLAQKVFEDACMNLDKCIWSEASGIKVEELKIMEREFLVGLDFDLLVSPKQLGALRLGVERIIARYMVHLGEEELVVAHAALAGLQKDIFACTTTGDARGTCN